MAHFWSWLRWIKTRLRRKYRFRMWGWTQEWRSQFCVNFCFL